MNILHTIFILLFNLISVLPSINSSQNAIHCNQSCPGSLLTHLPYPFGFSSGCQIQLNCTSDGTIFLSEFPVQEINNDTLRVSLPAKCGRPIDTLTHLVGKHYAPTSDNAMLMDQCTRKKTDCVISATRLGSDFQTLNCSADESDDVTCYRGNSSRMFLDYEEVSRMGCAVLVSGVVVEGIGGPGSNVSLEGQVVKLGWWVEGSCDCSGDADCVKIVSPVDGSDGYRCKCKSQFYGDGYITSSGCRAIKGTKGTARKLIIGISCSITGIIFLLFVIKYRKLRLRLTQKGHGATNDKIEIFIKNYGSLAPRRYKNSEIMKMTNSFLEKLGQGGYGSVYKGQFPDGRLVAVKVLSEATRDGEDFVNEVMSISKTSHVNIVTLLGFCIEGKKRALIYEFLSNGSLDKFLHGDESHLDWNTLFRISKGIARGLEYLYKGCNTRIVHFDIKPHNILLDEELVPKISDFGLAKLCKKKESIVSVTGARGTVGYMSPEVFFRSLGGASHKSDVYSYGMMVLEMTGAHKHNTTSRTSASESYFPDWIYEQVESGLDLKDYGVISEMELARKMMLVGLWCIQYDPSNRPSINKVIEMLEADLESLQVPPKRLWSSTTRSAHGISHLDSLSSATNSTSETLLMGKDVEKFLFPVLRTHYSSTEHLVYTMFPRN